MKTCLRLGTAALLACALVACVTKPTAPAADAGSLQASVQQLTDDLLAQAGPTMLERMVARRVVLDPFLDAQSGQETEATRQIGQLVVSQLQARNAFLRIQPFRADSVEQADYLITGAVRSATDKPAAQRDSVLLHATVTDRRTSLVVARAAVRVAAAQLNTAPTRVYADSPSLVRDRLTEGYLRTADAPVGSAGDEAYLASVSTAALIAEASEAYNQQQWGRALTLYEAAAKRPDGAQLRVLNGLYLAHQQLGQSAQAEAAFGRIVALGLATNNLAVRLLFQPGTTDFWRDPRVNGPYPMWLRLIAKESRAGTYCLTVVGHSSKTGSDATNERLSLARARLVRDALVTNDRALADATRVDGVGARQNIVGTGTDDLRDSVDRRVEFKVTSCERR